MVWNRFALKFGEARELRVLDDQIARETIVSARDQFCRYVGFPDAYYQRDFVHEAEERNITLLLEPVGVITEIMNHLGLLCGIQYEVKCEVENNNLLFDA